MTRPRWSAPGSARAHNVTYPSNSFAGVGPENARSWPKAQQPYDAICLPIPAGDLVKVQMTLKDMRSRSPRA